MRRMHQEVTGRVGSSVKDGSAATVRELPTDLDEIGMDSRLALSLPMLTMLLQCVAEGSTDWAYLNVTARNGAWVGAAGREPENFLTVSTNHGDAAPEPYNDERHASLISHGFEHVPAHNSYTQQITFDTDDAFLATAVLMVGTFQHVYGANLTEPLEVELRLQP